MSDAAQLDQTEDAIKKQAGSGDWVRVQQKTFTRWCANHLRKRGSTCADLSQDFSNGILLMKLISILYDKNMPRHNKVGAKAMRAVLVDNCSIALKMVEDAGVKFSNFKPLNLLEGEVKPILGLVWSIIYHYQLQPISISDMNAREGLLLWCQRKTKNYDDVDIKNFSSSWKSGLAFCALIHAHRPDLIDYKNLDKKDAAGNCQLAFDVAEKLGIPKFLDVEDIVDAPIPDEKAVMTYVSEYFHYFASQGDAETAARRVAKFIEFNQDKQSLIQEYEAKASELTNWVNAKKQELSARPEEVEGDIDVAAAKELLGQYWHYKTLEKPQQSVARFDAEAVHNNLQTKLRVFGRSPYVAPAGLSQAEIEAAWDDLGAAEQGRLTALQAHLAQVKDNLRLRFANAANNFVKYMEEKEGAIQGVSGDFEAQKATVMEIKEEVTFEGQKQLQDVAQVSDMVNAAGIKDNKHTDLTLEEVGLIWEELNTVLADRLQLIENMLARKAEKERLRAEQEAIEAAREALRVQFADRANALAPWINEQKNTLTSEGGSLEEQLTIVEKVIGAHADGDAQLKEAGELAERLREAGVQDNKHTEYTVGELQLLWDEVMNMANNKKTLIQNKQARRAEKERIRAELATIEAANENLRQLFANKAKDFNGYLGGLQKAMGDTGADQDTQLKNILQVQEDIAAGADRLTELAGIHQRVQDAGITENPHTDLTFEELNSAHAELGKQAETRIKFLENQIALRNANSDLPESTLAEYKKTFALFDKDKSGSLVRSEFKACVASLGQVLNDDELDLLIKTVDKSGDGTISENEFIAYMVERTQDKDTPEQVKTAFKFLAHGQATVRADDLTPHIEADKVAWFSDNAPSTEEGTDYNTFVDTSYE